MEYWDVYDENRNPLGKTGLRGVSLPTGEFHLVVDIILTNHCRQVLVTKRHPQKKNGGLWEFTGGGAMVGENSIQAILREVREEIGVDITPEQLTLIDTNQKGDSIMDVFTAVLNLPCESLILQSEEVIDAKWISIDELEQMDARGEMVRFCLPRFQRLRDKLKYLGRI